MSDTAWLAANSPNLTRVCQMMGELSPLPMAMVEGPFHIMCYVNPAFSRMVCKAQAELIGKPFCEMSHLGKEFMTLLDGVARGGEPVTHTENEFGAAGGEIWTYTLWPARAEGRALGIMIQVTETTQFHERMLAMNEALVLSSLRQDELIEAAATSNFQLHEEILARKQTEEVLERARALLSNRAGELERAVTVRTTELTATNKQLDAFVYSIAHDLRAPLRSMQGFSTMLIEDAGSALSETGRDYANRITLAARFMDSLLQDLLAFSRVAKELVQLEPVNVETVARGVTARMEPVIQERKGSVELIGPWHKVIAHAPTLGQVLTNLISNALKFVAPGTAPRVRVCMEERGKFRRIWVEDNGIGIPLDQAKKIFQVFTRLQGAKFPGTGIGLAIVEQGVERMEGAVGLDSVPGEGSRFWIDLKKA